MRQGHPRQHRETASSKQPRDNRCNSSRCIVASTSQVVGKNSRWWLARVDGRDALTTPEGTVLPFARFAGKTEAIVCGFERILVLESRGWEEGGSLNVERLKLRLQYRWKSY